MQISACEEDDMKICWRTYSHIKRTELTAFSVFLQKAKRYFNNYTFAAKFIEVFPWVLHQ